MNVFEDLVVELKEANLLETTVIDGLSARNPGMDVEPGEPEFPAMAEVSNGTPAAQSFAAKKVDSDVAFFRKKAVAEVASLELVEAVITGIEREYLKVVPRVFDDLNAKKALNTFANSDASLESEYYKAAEFELMAETEAWCSALAVRDRAFPVTSLREYCERSRPALSSQALLGLGRFYRNLPYTEQVRSKFDFVITRLFSRAVDRERRICLFDRSEMLVHINTLYSDWSSISLYSVEDGDINVALTAMSFDELAAEAQAASSFDELIESDFFGRLRMFKESISDLFFAPAVTCAAISANVRIGNAYVELIDLERQKSSAESLRDRYAQHDDQVSETTGKTLQLSKLLNQLEGSQSKAASPATETMPTRPSKARFREPRASVARTPSRTRQPAAQPLFFENIKAGTLSVNKWVLISGIVIITLAAVLYALAGSASG